MRSIIPFKEALSKAFPLCFRSPTALAVLNSYVGDDGGRYIPKKYANLLFKRNAIHFPKMGGLIRGNRHLTTNAFPVIGSGVKLVTCSAIIEGELRFSAEIEDGEFFVNATATKIYSDELCTLNNSQYHPKNKRPQNNLPNGKVLIIDCTFPEESMFIFVHPNSDHFIVNRLSTNEHLEYIQELNKHGMDDSDLEAYFGTSK